MYFDNCGGVVSDEVILKLEKEAGIVLCGQVAAYNSDLPYPPPLGDRAAEAVRKRNIQRKRFLLLAEATAEEQREAAEKLARRVASGKLLAAETVANGITSLPQAFVSMMAGGNVGKQLVQFT